jgi:hypothetical protein
MSIFGKLFGNSTIIKEGIEHLSKGLDMSFYTEEEKAIQASKDKSEARKMVVDWIKASSGQNLARRIIALSITGVWLGMYVLSSFALILGVFLTSYTDQLNELSKIATTSSDDMQSAVMLILAFYFAAPHMGLIAERFAKKNSKD